MKMMPIQTGSATRRGKMPCIKAVPFSMFDGREARCQDNHSQSLERIRERSGFGAAEAVAVLEDLDIRAAMQMNDEHAKQVLMDKLRAWLFAHEVIEKKQLANLLGLQDVAQGYMDTRKRLGEAILNGDGPNVDSATLEEHQRLEDLADALARAR